ncbi:MULTISPECIES: phage tail tape measure protein [Lactobacillus]|uniref:phage tail tape measure protein n=1 Tax=Lactobacillus TaxID=1578 RepID=UPI001AAFD635|nr:MULTISPECIES: phage tail tape measure protein [Lactobacillus]MCZ9641999.1 phage tail tape measure protein [Lactobacillus jensenii]MCZ9649908.1 phage tail tape measure protein [Lactobacillus mulieris]MCZ9655597.1 phage tail tape measure protein [Lactobacillus iners]MCZ9656525.1 phage tail tape measure protein [Lactobacillus jensenii]MCZ9660744.1 phage tail tape measure protein [Lactobacillus jensenii]
MADDVIVKIGAVDNGLSIAFNKAGEAVQSFGTTVNKSLGTVGKGLMVAGAATTAMGVSSVKSFGQFQQSLNTAAVVAGGTSKDIKGLADVANKMGADLPLSAQDAADAMIEMARNGASLDDLKQQFPAIAKAATAAGSDLQQTAGVVQLAMNVWGNSLKSPAQAAEILVQTANLSNASVEEMRQAIADVGSTAKLCGYDMQTTSTAIGLLTNSGLPAAQAAQDLNFALLRMVAPTKGVKSAMQQLGISVRDQNGNMKPLPTILNDVAKATSGMGKAQRDAALKALFGTAGMKAMVPLLDAVKDKSGKASTSWDGFSKAIDKAAGSTERANKTLDEQASEMQKNVGAKVEQLGGNWESLRNSVMQSNNKMTGSILDLMNNTLDWAQNSNSSIAKVVRGFIGLSPVIGPAMTAVGGFLTKAKTIGSVLGGTVKVVGKVGGAFINWGRSLVGLPPVLSQVTTSASKAGKGSKQLGEGADKAGASSKASAKEILAMGAAAFEIGAGIAVAAAGIALLVLSVAQLAKTGPAGAQALLAVTTSIATLLAVLKIVGPSLKENASGLLAFGAAALAIGASIGIASAGIALLVVSLTQLAKTGTNVPATMLAIGAALTAFAVGLGLVSPLLQKNVAGIMAFSVAALAVGSAIAIASAGLALLVASLTQLAKTGTNANTTVLLIVGGITALVAVFALLGPALTAGIAGIMAFSVAMIAIGTAIAIASAGLAILITALTNLITTMATLNISGQQFMTTMQQIGIGLAKLITSFVTTLVAAIPQIIALVLNGLVQVNAMLIQYIPIFAAQALQMIAGFLNALAQGIPQVIQSATNLIVNFCNALAQNMPQIVTAAVNLITSFVDTLTQNLPKLIDTGVNFIVNLIEGITEKIPDLVNAAVDLITKFLDALAKRAPDFVNSAINLILSFIDGVGQKISDVVSAALKLIRQFLKAITDAIPKMTDIAVEAVGNFVEGVGYALGRVLSSGGELIQRFISGVLKGLSGSRNAGKSNGNAVESALKSFNLISIGKYLISGFISGITSMVGSVVRAAANVGKAAVNSIKSFLHIHSPSRLMRDEVGYYFVAGFAKGITDNLRMASQASNRLAEASVFDVPSIDMTNYNRGIKQLTSNDMSGSIATDLRANLAVTQQPAYVTLSLGGSDYQGFVDDISKQQDMSVALRKKRL